MVNNDYMSCDFYQNRAKNVNNEDFVSFFDEKEAKYYFAFADNKTQKIIFRSEGYPTIAARDKGLNAVLKNKSEVKLLSIVEENKEFFVILKAKNHVEIARSCPFTTKKLAQNTIDFLIGKVVAIDNEIVVTKTVQKATVKKEAKKEIAKVSEPKASKTVIKSEVKITKTTKETDTAAALKTTKTTINAKTTEPFVNSELYLGHDTIEDQYGKTGFALFSAENKHFFVVYNQDGSIFQRSLGFDTMETRNDMFENMKNVITNENAYRIVENNNIYNVELVKDGTVLSSSTEFLSYTEAFQRTPKGWTKPTETVGTLY